MITLTINDYILRCTLAGVHECFQGAYRFLEMKMDIFWYPLQSWTYFGIHFKAGHILAFNMKIDSILSHKIYMFHVVVDYC